MPECYGNFNDYDNYCWDRCPYSYCCEEEKYWWLDDDDFWW